MDFFEQQERSRRNSRWLVLWYALALVLTVACYAAAAGAACALFSLYWHGAARVPMELPAAVALAASVIILAASAWRTRQVADGASIARLLGARLVEPGRCTPAERKLLNVVEEMAIASGLCVPPVYVLQAEHGVNALVAGHTPHEAVVIVTRGAAEKLSRDELQGVMGHEFSHILNGDMALNLRLVGLLAGLTWFGSGGERLVYRAAYRNKDLPREERGEGVIEGLAGGLVALVGFPGTFAADAIKAAISRERERLADAASVQFTRNPEAIAGALDSILAMRAHTSVLALHADEFSHMFFAPAVARWWGFPTHPPILERIQRVHPRFQRDEYRRVRHGARSEVAVLDGAGNVVKVMRAGPAESALGALAVVASIGMPKARHVDYAARLLATLPSRLREALQSAEEAEATLFSLALCGDEAGRRAALHALAERRGAAAAAKASDLLVYTAILGRRHMLTLAEMAVPAIKAQRQEARDAFVADLARMIEADRRVTLREFVLLTLLRQRLREGAGEPIPSRYAKIEEVALDAHAVLSLVAHAASGNPVEAFQRGAAVLRLGWQAPLAREALTFAGIAAALEALRLLSPFAKPALLKACLETASSGGMLRIAQAELVRMVAATLDCPVPPLVAELDPRRLAA
ncbi:MAG: M48 family metalloprotease [Betaproteobacteria bacterium]